MIPVKSNQRSVYVGMFKAWALGVSTVISGLFFGFNSGFSAGFGSFMIIAMLMGTAYVFFSFSIAEVISGLPFAGGAYGLARMSLGFYPGFLIGCFEALEYIFFTSAIMTSFSQMLVTSYSLNDQMVPILSFIGYFVAVIIHLSGPQVFWTYTCSIAIIAIILLLTYCFGSLQFVNFPEYSVYSHGNQAFSHDQYFVGGGDQYMKIFHVSAWLYVGVEAIGFMNDTVDEPTKSIPTGYVAAMLTLFTLSIFMLFVVSSLPPDMEALSGTLLPLNAGYQKMFNISPEVATLLSLPATYTAAFEFIFPYSKLLVALASSNLFPPFLKKSFSNGVHYAAIICGSLLSYSACVLYYFYPELLGYTFSVCTLATFLIYISQLIGYIRFVTVYSNIQREFRSPFGIYGAVYSLCIYATGAISVVVFEEHHYSVIVVVVFMFAESIYYFFFVKDYQVFSEEETRVMYLCHMINYHLQEKLDPHGKVSIPQDDDELQSVRSSNVFEINQSKISCASYLSPRVSYRNGCITPSGSKVTAEVSQSTTAADGQHKFVYEDALPMIDEITENL